MTNFPTFMGQLRQQLKTTPTETNDLVNRIITWQQKTVLQPFYSMHQLMGVFNTCARLLGPKLLEAGWSRKRTYRINQPCARWWVPPVIRR